MEHVEGGKSTCLLRLIAGSLPRKLALALAQTARRLHDHTSKTYKKK